MIKRKLKLYHLFCIDCNRGWHFASSEDAWLIDQVHNHHRRLGLPVAVKCGPECANDWEMCKNANV